MQLGIRCDLVAFARTGKCAQFVLYPAQTHVLTASLFTDILKGEVLFTNSTDDRFKFYVRKKDAFHV